MTKPERIVIIGGVAGGATAAAKARRCCPEAEIEIYDRDEFISYAGCGLPYFIGGRSPNWRKLLASLPDEFESRHNIRVFLSHRVNSIDPGSKSVRVADLVGVSEFHREYDKLIIATGATPFVPPLPGTDLQGVFVLRSLTNALEMKSYIDLQAPARAVVVGAGSIGLEMCEALVKLDMEVHLVELTDQVLPPLDNDMTSGISRQLEEKGIQLHLGERLEGLEGEKGSVKKVVTSGGELQADMVLLSLGIKPVSELAEKAGLELGAGGAIRVDEYMRTNIPDILACGDCATTHHMISGEESWIPLGSTARKQGRTAAETASGNEVSFPGVQGTFILKTFDLSAGKTGLSIDEAEAAGFEAERVDFEDSSLPDYYGGGGDIAVHMTVDKQSGRVLGVQMVGDYAAVLDKRLDIFSTAIRAGLTAGDMTSLDLGYAPPFSPPLDLPIVGGYLAEARVLGKTCYCTVDGLEDRGQ